MPATVPKNRWTEEFKGFHKVYKKVAVMRELLQRRALKQQENLTETQQMLQALDERAKMMLQAAPEPVDELPEQGGQ